MVRWQFWRRDNKKNNEVPAEIKQYYEAERRERTGIAWLLAFATLLVTVALSILLFFGGRWAYRAVFDSNGDNDRQEVAQQEQQSPQDNSQPNEQPEPAAGGEQEETPPPAPAPTQTPQPTPTPTPTPERHPATGPEHVVAVFAGAVIVGTAAYQVKARYALKSSK